MSVLGISGPSPLPPTVVSERDKSDRKIIWIVIGASAGAFVAFIVLIASFSVHYASQYGSIDKSKDSLSWDPDLSDPVFTTFASPSAGVTLKLPGKWEHSKNSTRFLCHLISPDGFNAVLELDFPILTPSIDVDAAQVGKRYQLQNQWSIVRDQSLEVSGQPAHLLRMDARNNIALDLLLIKKWPAVYGLSIAGPSTSSDAWRRIEDALPQSIKIQ